VKRFKEYLRIYLKMDDISILYIFLSIFFCCSCFISIIEFNKMKHRRKRRLNRIGPAIEDEEIKEAELRDNEIV